MVENREFALLVGKAFLRELHTSNTDGAIAFGRAFLLALGNKGPVSMENHETVNGRERSHESIQIES
ncbi:MAG TPA: hypothetical protein VMW71_00230 [Thermoplasmata archaeon]|nr:hypothetical protein [Thermoplasmata archaeon]